MRYSAHLAVQQVAGQQARSLREQRHDQRLGHDAQRLPQVRHWRDVRVGAQREPAEGSRYKRLVKTDRKEGDICVAVCNDNVFSQNSDMTRSGSHGCATGAMSGLVPCNNPKATKKKMSHILIIVVDNRHGT